MCHFSRQRVRKRTALPSTLSDWLNIVSNSLSIPEAAVLDGDLSSCGGSGAGPVRGQREEPLLWQRSQLKDQWRWQKSGQLTGNRSAGGGNSGLLMHGAAENCMFSSLLTTLRFDFLICCRFPMLTGEKQGKRGICGCTL